MGRGLMTHGGGVITGSHTVRAYTLEPIHWGLFGFGFLVLFTYLCGYENNKWWADRG